MQPCELKRIDIEQLPQSLRMLIDCIGIEHAYRLTSIYGGRPKYIPKHSERTSVSYTHL